MNAKLISVIVPIYKVEEYLDKCITSIVQQTYPNLEIILVDDGSPDSSPAICDHWAQQDERIQVIHKKNGGVSSARNAGLRAAKGQFISFVDPDDYIEPKMLEMMIAEMRDEQVDVVQCGYNEMLNGNVEVHSHSKKRMSADTAVKSLLLWDGYVQSYLWNKLYRRSILMSVEFCEDLRYGEDTVFIYQALRKAVHFVQIPFVGYCYVRRDNSLVAPTFQSYKLQSLQAAKIIADAVEKDYPQFVEQAHCHVVFDAFFLINNLFLVKRGKQLFKDEYATCIQTLRKGIPAVLKKYMSAKRYFLYKFCCIAPSIYQFFYCTWQKMQRKYHG